MNKQELVAVKKNTVDVVTQNIKGLEQRGEIQFPPDYSPQNALRAAWLILQNTQDRNKRPVLQTCTQTSIINALFDMVIQGLNPVKKQCYFIAYGNQLTCQRSYHGTMSLAKRVDPSIGEIVAEVVWEGDEFEYEIVNGQKRVVKHKQTLESVDSKKLKGAYCIILDKNGNIKKTEIMSFEQIKTAWKKSKASPVDSNGNIKAGSTHYEFMEEMAKKTVINRACKSIINSSSDAYLRQSVQRQDMIEAEIDADAQLPAPEAMKVIDVTDAEPEQPEQQEQPALEQEQEKQAVEMPAPAHEIEPEPAF
jgi:recombination protein RecT